MIRRAVIGLFALVALLLVLLCLVTYSLLGTATGNRWLLQQVDHLIPGELTVDTWQGNLLGTMELGGIRYRNDALMLELDQLSANLKPMTLTGGWLTFEHLQLGALHIHTEASNDDDNAGTLPDSLVLPIGIRIEQLSVREVQLNDTSLVKQLQGESLVAWRRFQFARLDATVAGDLQLNASAHGQLTAPYPLDSRIRWQKPLPPSDALSASLNTTRATGELIAEGPITDLQLTHTLTRPLQIQSEGHWQQADGQWRVDLQHQWAAQPLPILEDKNVENGLTLEAGQLTTRGPLSGLQLKGHSGLRRNVPEQAPQTLDVILDATLNGQTLNIAELTLRQSQQRLTGKGALQLQPLQWDLALNGDIDTGIFSPQLPGQLSIDGNSKGRIDDNGWRLEPGTLSASGSLRQQPLHLKARSHGTANNLQVDGDLRWGDNRLQLNGKVWPQWQLQGQLALNTLAQLQPDLHGSLAGQLRISGATATPRFSGQLEGQGLGRDALLLSRLSAEFNNLGIGPQSQQLTLSGSQLQIDRRTVIDTLSVNADGKLDQHQLSIQLQQADTSLSTRLDGALVLPSVESVASARWQGNLHDTHLQHQQLGDWQQASPSPLRLSLDQQQLGSFCLQQQQSRLCAQGSLDDRQQVALNAQAEALPLDLLSALLGPDYSLEGTLHGQADIAGTLTAPQGKLNLHTRGARVTFNVQDGPPPWTLDNLSLDTELDGEQAHSRVNLSTALGQINADIQHGFSLDAPMDGQASFQIERLSAVEMLTADVRDVQGKVEGDVELGGTPRTPVIEGTVALHDGHALIPALGIAVSNMQLTLQGSPQGRLAVNGEASMGEGTLLIGGYLDPSQWPLALQLTFRGERLLVAERPDARVFVSPDLTLAGDLKGLMLKGSLQVPEAAIHPEQLPEGAITVSDDQVLVHQEGDSDQRLPLGMDVTVALGDKVTFNGFGLNATLGGTLQILQQPLQPPQLNGELVVLEGRYRAYGQNLAISDGQLIFQGQPDNPGLDIRAYRKIPSEAITVGVQLSGTLQSPEASLYSDPGMETSQIMSYLLTGRPLESGTQGESSQIAQALALYGLEKGSGVTEKIGDKLGVDEITVGSDWETEDAALMLGKQLSERLYLTYAIGLFDAVSTVMLRYTLTRSLHLEARSSSEANSLDLIWEKELR